MFGNKFNFDDVFLRDLTICVLDKLESQIKWNNRFTTGNVFVEVPFYYSLTGDERFLLDSFVDDIVDCRSNELNTDIIPRGHITMTGFNIKSDEFANPNVWLRTNFENDSEMRKLLVKVRAIPVSVSYDMEILLSSEIDVFKCSQSMINALWLYNYMNFEYNLMAIDAIAIMPDSNNVDISREANMQSSTEIRIKTSFTVETYYPSYRTDRINAAGQHQTYGSGMTDNNGHAFSGGYSEYFNQPSKSTPYGQTTSFADTDGVNPPDVYGDSLSTDYYSYGPKRSRWYNNLLKLRGNGNMGSNF